MEIIFGMHLDGAEWSQKEASLGKLQLGPAGLLGFLETQLGLTGLTEHPAQRINEYMRRMELCDHQKAWFHKSLQADAWSTAKQMLSWRDELIEAGWDGLADDETTPRLQALADIEATTKIPLSSGREDRLQAVLRLLTHQNNCGITAILTQELCKLLPPVWQRVFLLLTASGVRIEKAAEENNQTGSNNLSQVRCAITTEDSEVSLTPYDETLILLKADDEWEAAEHLAMWLAADTESNEKVTIICGSRSDVLDQALAHQGLPVLGRAEDSKWRSVLQVLPLVLSNAWKPVDINLLVELLTLPVSPVPRFASRHLLHAASNEPGVGGDAWREALCSIAAEREEITRKKSYKRVEHDAYTKKLDEMLASNRFDSEVGISEEDLRERCQWVIESLIPRVETSPMFIEAISHAREMQKLASGKGLLSRVKVERMLDSVIATGCTAPDRSQQAATWRVVNHPQQITWECGTVIWWGFYDQGQTYATHWSQSERSYLESRGGELEPTERVRLREAESWKHSIRQAQNSLIFIAPERMKGEAVYAHPFWDEVCYTALKSGNEQELSLHLTRNCAKLAHDGNWQLAGRSMQLTKAEPHTKIVRTAVKQLQPPVEPCPQKLSYSQMWTMLGCPMKWALHYHAGLRMSDAIAVPTGNQMIGSLTHHIVEKLYAESVQVRDTDETARKVRELYDEFVPSQASELLLPGRELENMRYKKAVVRGVGLLVEAIKRARLSIVETEHEIERAFTSNGTVIPFKGYVDLMLKDEYGKIFVLDMKWSQSSNYYKKNLEEGSALQLAAYGWLLRADNNNAWPESGYFMLAQGELLSDSPIFGEGALTSERSSKDIWGLATNTWQQRLSEIRSGKLEASGISEQAMKALGLNRDKVEKQKKEECHKNNLLYQRPPCMFCDFGVLCGLIGGAS